MDVGKDVGKDVGEFGNAGSGVNGNQMEEDGLGNGVMDC